MNKTVLLPVILALLFTYCSKNWKEKSDTNSTVFDIQKSEILIPSNNDLIKIDLTDGQASATIQKNENQTVYIEFSSKGSKKLSAICLLPIHWLISGFRRYLCPTVKWTVHGGAEIWNMICRWMELIKYRCTRI